MPLKRYSVLKGRPVRMRFGSGASPHYQIQVAVDDADYRIAVNIQSIDKSQVEFLIHPRFDHPITEGLSELREGWHALPPGPGGLNLDYIRANLLQPEDMIPLPGVAPGPDNDLNEKLNHYVQ